jgi:hypothetical protein
MERLKLRRVTMRVVSILLAAYLILGCQGVHSVNSDSQELNKGGTYTIDRFHAKRNSASFITCEFFHFSTNEKTIAGLHINEMIVYPKDSGKSTFKVKPGKYKIRSGFPGKKWTVLDDINIVRGDSLVIKIYLEDDDRPLVD